MYEPVIETKSESRPVSEAYDAYKAAPPKAEPFKFPGRTDWGEDPDYFGKVRTRKHDRFDYIKPFGVTKKRRAAKKEPERKYEHPEPEPYSEDGF